MGEIATILQSAILYVAGNEGMDKFSKAGHDAGTDKIIHTDGSLDLPQLMNILLDVFPEEQASAITDNVLAKYMEAAGEEQKKAAEGEAESVDSYEDNLAKYLATETSDVRDLINEARRIRQAMGKSVTVRVTTPPGPAEKPGAEPPKPAISLVAPLTPEDDKGREALEAEVREFVKARKAYTSVDIMDFIRYLKDKGYHFQENIVLEDVYTRLEERKGRERAALMADILGFLERLPWPTESEVSAFIEQKKSEGVMCEGAEIKRMILVEMIRKH